MKLLTVYANLGKNIYLISLVKFIRYMGFFVLPYLSLYITKELGFEIGIASLFATISAVLAIGFSFFGSKLCSSIQPKVIASAAFVMTAIFFILAILSSQKHIEVGFILLGVGISNMALPALDANIVLFSKKEKRTNSFSMVYLFQNMGFAIASLLMGYLFMNNPTNLFFGEITVCIISAILIYKYLDPMVEARESLKKKQSFSAILWNVKKFDKKVVFLIVALNNIAYGQIAFTLPLYLEKIGMNAPLTYGHIMAINAIGVIILSPLVTTFFSTKNFRMALMIAEMAFVFGYMGYALSGNNAIAFYICTIMWTVGEITVSISALAYLTQDLPMHGIGYVSSIFLASQKIGAIISPILGMFFLRFININYVWIIVAGIVLLGLVMLLGSTGISKKNI